MKYFANTSWIFAEKILRMVVGLFVGIWVARYLGPEQFGLFAYAQSFVGIFATIATLGLDSIVIRELVKDHKRRDELIGTAFWLKLFGAFVVLGLLALAVNFTSNSSFENLLIFIIASTTIFQSFNVIDIYFQSRVLSKYVVYSNTVALFMSSFVKITLIFYEAPLIAFVWVVVFEHFVVVSGLLYFYIRYSRVFDITKLFPRKEIAISLLKDSWSLILSGVIISIYMRIDQVMIKEILGSAAVGQYAVAVRLSEAWYFIPIAIAGSLFPAIINAKSISEELYYDRMQKLYSLMVGLGVAIAIPVLFLGDWIVELLYGTQYNQAGSVLVIHIWAGVFVFLGVASGKWLVAENLQIFSLWRTFSGMIANVILNYILIPKYGIQGAALSTLVSQMIAAYIFDFFNIKTKKIFYMKTRSLLFLNKRLETN